MLEESRTKSNDFNVEVKSALWQKIAAFVVCLFVSGFCVIGMLQMLLPSRFPNVYVQTYSEQERILAVLGLTVFFLIGLYLLWSSLHYRLWASDEGIMQSDGLRRVRVRWSEVGSYRWRVRKGTGGTYREPVLLGHDGRILFQPFAHMITSDPTIMQSREEFWQFVIAHCPQSANCP